MVTSIKGLPKYKQGDSIRVGRIWLVVLFTFTLVFSVLYNLPASWLTSQPVIQKQIPQLWLIESVKGSVWNGEVAASAHIINKPGVVLGLGVLKWDIEWLPLLNANLGSQLEWHVANNSQIDFHIKKDLLYSEELLLLSNIQGSIDIAQLIPRLSAVGLGVPTTTGQIVAMNVDMALNPVTLWPQEISGQFEIRSLSTLGVNLPIIKVESSMEAQTILLSLSAQESGWQLKGRIGMRANHTYDITLSVKGDSVQKMPDWAQLMVQKTPTLATFKSQGRW